MCLGNSYYNCYPTVFKDCVSIVFIHGVQLDSGWAVGRLGWQVTGKILSGQYLGNHISETVKCSKLIFGMEIGLGLLVCTAGRDLNLTFDLETDLTYHKAICVLQLIIICTFTLLCYLH